MIRNTLIFLAMISILSCQSTQHLPTVEKVDIEKYSGTWYEIARLPNSFEKGLKCTSANYTLKKNGKIEVLNRGYYIAKQGKINEAKGTAWVPDADFPGRLKVSFFWPFAGNYYIVSLDENYGHVLVGDPSRKYLWILSRSKMMDEATYKKLLDIAKNNGFDIDSIIKVAQDCK